MFGTVSLTASYLSFDRFGWANLAASTECSSIFWKGPVAARTMKPDQIELLLKRMLVFGLPKEPYSH